jgi:phosphoribosylaminoimidazole-succinocarboxamide synthase
MLPVEFVVRGYLAGSGWVEYRDTAAICGHRLPPGLVESERLPEPILTPATKALEGHDLNITEAHAEELCGAAAYGAARAAALALYRFAADRAEECGLILADTKFELGLDEAGVVTLGDEALTPDSSRYWPADDYAPGRTQSSFDKQYVRDWCLATGWDRTAPGPALPDDVVAGTRARYVEAFERITGIAFERYVDDPQVVLCA